MSTLEYFFYELPHKPQFEDDYHYLILSGYRTNVRVFDVYPFGFAASYLLDERSQALIGEKSVTVNDVELLHDEIGAYQIKEPDLTPQLSFDFDAPVAEKAKPKPEPRYLTLEMSRGEVLGKVLKSFSKQQKEEFVTLTREGIIGEKKSIPYPKGITANGIGAARIRSECLWRLLGATPPAPSFPIAYKSRFSPAAPVRSKDHFFGLGKAYAKITINGSVVIQSGKFTARIPTESED